MNGRKKYTLSLYLAVFSLFFMQDTQTALQSHKKYTLVVFMAADNNLYPYALHNIKQMELIGSNEHINILVQINTPGKSTITERFFIEKGKKILITAPGQAPTEKLNSGNPQTLIDCVTWAMKYYPADNLILNLWSHGVGICDPTRYPKLNSQYDDENEQESNEFYNRGICFDDTHKSYLTNQDLKKAVTEIQNKPLHGKKISIIWLEACLMSMIEIMNIFKNHADYLVSSENVEYAPGSSYPVVLSAFLKETCPSPETFARHIVNSFQQSYSKTKLNFTQSAVNLSKVSLIEENINLVAQHILIGIEDQKNKSVTTLLKKCKSKTTCTCFHEVSFIDLRHFYTNLQVNLNQIALNNKSKEIAVRTALARLLHSGIELINNAVIANATGQNLKNAGGISIYFPENGIFSSYLKSTFAQSNNWSKMLTQYILQSK